MRKYIFGLLAIATVIGTFAFGQPEKKAQVDMYVFEFDGTQSGGYSVSNVEDESNTSWKYKGKNLALCNNTDDKACRVRVPAAYVDDVNAPTELSGIIITATLSGSTAHVTGISGTGTQYSNQPD